MSRERITYRDNLEALSEYFGNRRVLTLRDVSNYTGRDPRWCKKTYGIDPKQGISVPTLARKLSGATIW